MIKYIILVIVALSIFTYSILALLSPISHGEYYWHYKWGWYPKQVKFEQGMTLYGGQSTSIPMIFQIPKGSTLCIEPKPEDKTMIVSPELLCKENSWQ